MEYKLIKYIKYSVHCPLKSPATAKTIFLGSTVLTIYAPMIYTAPCVMLLMQAASITWASGRGLGPGNRKFLGPVKWHRADRRVPFWAKKTR